MAQTAMLVEGHTAGSLGTQVAHSGGQILSVGEVAEAAVGLVGSRRVIVCVPRHRGGLVRATALAPSMSRHVMGAAAALGRRTLARSAG